jgi:hypothetical protein
MFLDYFNTLMLKIILKTKTKYFLIYFKITIISKIKHGNTPKQALNPGPDLEFKLFIDKIDKSKAQMFQMHSLTKTSIILDIIIKSIELKFNQEIQKSYVRFLLFNSWGLDEAACLVKILHKKKKLALIINGLDIASIHIFLI